MKIQYEWGGKTVCLTDTDNQVFYGVVDHITGKADNDETNRDSLTLFDGEHYIFFSDHEIKEIEMLNG